MSKLPEIGQNTEMLVLSCPMLTSEKFIKNAKYYNGLKTTIERFEHSKQDFLKNAASLHKTSIDQLLIDFKGLASSFHSEIITDLKEDCQLLEKVSPYCKKANKLFKDLKVKLEDQALNEENEGVTEGSLPSVHLLDDEDNIVTLTKYAKFYDGINTTINLLKITLDNYVEELSKSTNMEPQLIIDLLGQKSPNFHEDILKLVDKGFIKIPDEFKSYCRDAEKLVFGLDEDNLDLDTNVFKKACPVSHDKTEAVNVMGVETAEQ